MNRRRRIRALVAALLLLLAALGVQAVTATPPAEGPIGSADDAYPGNTLITVQSFDSFTKDNGEAFIVSPEGEIVWRFDPPDSRVFDAERLDDETVMVSMATQVSAVDCPEAYQRTDPNPAICVRNRVVEVDIETNEIGWSYSWYDAWVQDHEVHDADRLQNGDTAIVDMGNERAFVVNRAGEVVWEWEATEHIGPGTDFWDEYVPEANQAAYRRKHPEGDWTHINDIDSLENGNLLLSIRNFDVVLEVDDKTGDIVTVTGQPGGGPITEQHDPNHLGGPDTMLVADSLSNRIVELDSSGEPIWTYTGSEFRLQWPRDADRLPNGNTLIVDSRNFRVVEVNATGDVVWQYSLRSRRGIVYDADRQGLPEEPDDVPGATAFPEAESVGTYESVTGYIESWAAFVFPSWVGFSELITILLALVLAIGLGIDLNGYYREA